MEVSPLSTSMRRLSLFLFLSVLWFTACLPQEECLAGGFDNGIIGPRGSAMGTAFAGLADDPTAIFYNPAGVALLERKRGLSVTVRYSTTDLKFEFPEGRTTPSGKTGGKSTLVGRIAEVEDMVGWILFLAAPESSYLTGQTIAVNGGRLMV